MESQIYGVIDELEQYISECKPKLLSSTDIICEKEILQGFIDDQAQWANGFEGKILLSDSANRTASFDESLNLTYTKNRTFYETNLKELKHELKKI